MKTSIFFRSLIGVVLSLSLISCEDVVSVDLDPGQSQLAVDALVMVNDGPQTIRLTMTNAYFDNGTQAAGASGATVKMISSTGQELIFAEDTNNPGNYVFPDTVRGKTGELFGLLIDYKGQKYQSGSMLVRGTKVDSLYQEERKAEFGNEAGTYLYLRANDSLGVGDFCWIRYSLNGKRDLRPGRILVAADAAFNPGDADGLEFIYPVRNSINSNKPYLFGDKIDVELVSIDAENFRFLTEMQTQINNTGLFAEPASNVRSNIFNADKNSKVQAVGCFGITRVSRASVTIQ
ncbi:MAG TPA: DUF4249 family protein [Catalimonadaceae bacterium]|nr:DUF4249 family protein [Catalimonadaceae bacterium]HPI10828.1 DUF4249 family protein [Catalimonadaceae bacterium]